MQELKKRIHENGIDYVLVGDYYVPKLKMPEEKRSIGHYGRLHWRPWVQDGAWHRECHGSAQNRSALPAAPDLR